MIILNLNSSDSLAQLGNIFQYCPGLQGYWAYTVSLLGREDGYTVKYVPEPEGNPQLSPNTDIIPFLKKNLLIFWVFLSFWVQQLLFTFCWALGVSYINAFVCNCNRETKDFVLVWWYILSIEGTTIQCLPASFLSNTSSIFTP